MNAAEEALFTPGEINFSNLNDKIYEGCGKVNDNGVLNIDLGQLRDNNTATVCLLLELWRVARQRQCRVKATNISQQLRKLLNLYQISKFWPEK